MCKAILIMLLAAASSNTAAEWVTLGGNTSTINYVDPTTILRSGNKVKIWNLFDLKIVQTYTSMKPYLSQKSQYEFDCKEEQFRQLHAVYYFENMGKGESVTSDSGPGNWEPVSPDSSVEDMQKIACGKQ